MDPITIILFVVGGIAALMVVYFVLSMIFAAIAMRQVKNIGKRTLDTFDSDAPRRMVGRRVYNFPRDDRR
jgi:hypothetical protein